MTIPIPELANLTLNFTSSNLTGYFTEGSVAPTLSDLCNLALGAKEELLLRYVLVLAGTSVLYLFVRKGIFPERLVPTLYGFIGAAQVGCYAMLLYLLVFVK